jgi:hypothetical protein
VVKHFGELGASQLQALNSPRPVRIDTNAEGEPVAFYSPLRRYEVEEIVERWRIDDDWWREQPISRLYFRLLLEGGAIVDVFHDLVSGRWAKQSY